MRAGSSDWISWPTRATTASSCCCRARIEVRPDPSLDGHENDAPALRRGSSIAPSSSRVGIRIEDKGAIVALHWRGAENEGAAESVAHEIASEAEWQGLDRRTEGRKVLEIRPNVSINKGIAVAAALISAAAADIDAALYGGDDRTDVDAFTALRTLRDDGRAAATACIAVDLRRIATGGLAGGRLSRFPARRASPASSRRSPRMRRSDGLLRPAADDGSAGRRVRPPRSRPSRWSRRPARATP